MGNAMTALGGDMGALSYNPAASGVYRYSEFTLTPSLYSGVTTTGFLNGSFKDSRTRFALSNVLRSKGRENKILLDWLARNTGRYQAVGLDYSYSNSSYQTKDRSSSSEEVLIINYEPER